MAEDGWQGRDRLADPDRLRALRQVGAEAAPDPAFDRFASLVHRMLGVPVALVSLVDDRRQYFPGEVGLGEPWAGKRETPLSHSFCRHVVTEGVAKVFPDARIYAQVRDNLAIPDLGVVAYAGVPLNDAEGRTLGSLCAIDTRPRAWTADELAILTDLAEACASELRLRIERTTAEEARQHAESAHAQADRERRHAEEARTQAETAHEQLAMLAELTETFATTFDAGEGMRQLAAGVVPRLADWSLVTLAGKEGEIRHAAGAHRDPERAADMERYTELVRTGLTAQSMVPVAQRLGRPVRRSGESREAMLARVGDPELVETAERLGIASYVIVPITAPVTREVLGSLALVNRAGRAEFSEADERTAVDIARRAGLAIDNSRLYAQQRHVAEVLQHSMLPALPTIPGFELHARYLPAQDGAAVGGDWYDAFAQPDGSLMLAVGDVSGHDIEAAASMGQLRNLVRGDAYGRDDDPGPLLAQLDRAVHGLALPTAATAVLARVRRADEGFDVAFANAGHPPPMLVHPDGRVEVWWETPQPLLGLLPRTVRTTHRRRVPSGATLVLYTDGLVERPDEILDEGIARIRLSLAKYAGRPGQEIVDLLIADADRHTDDTALLLVRFQ
ncbi:SpoIIE family protein phosphatase [Symbioplanes lichenis]|uniref:SpoIIE family protein phosphatase n=1 Tax=Symbioplanes lichenis TaxID=1629072 RepID=UPI002739C2C4|nr:SpoIIE family protein phosphatase [Actinoplanes lichenis]